jgi:two-component system sensor histidine kinase/response regulator
VSVSRSTPTIHDPEGRDPEDTSPASLPLEGKQVLLVEDCPDQGRLYLKFLQLAGAKVTLECTGHSAVDAIRRSPALYDAVVLDFQMPEMDGLHATMRLREQGYRGAILAVTAHGSEELRQAWFEAGCNDFLEKPFEDSTLINTLELHLPQER